jgi:hypothetical protein
MTRPRIAAIQRAVTNVTQAVRRRRHGRASERSEPDDETADELARRLDATRERLRREIPPRTD